MNASGSGRDHNTALYAVICKMRPLWRYDLGGAESCEISSEGVHLSNSGRGSI